MLNQQCDHMDIASGQAGRRGLNAMADALNTLLADLFLVYFKTRNYHWHLSGSNLWDYGMLLEHQSTDIISCMDDVAGRLQALGLPALRPLEEVAQQRIRRGRAEDTEDAAAMLQELLADKHRLIRSLRGAKALAGRLEDGITAGLMGKWLVSTERHIWSLLKTL
jgi:starvation-inducible DNA-binding protein